MPMLRRLCMCIVNKCTTYLALSAAMFDAPEQMIEKLKVAIELCQSTKSVYMAYRQRASDEPLPQRVKEVLSEMESAKREGAAANVWLELEMRFAQPLDLFVERCQEVLFMLRIHIQFGQLKSVHLGGTQGRGHTRLVQQMCTELNTLMVHLKGVSAQLLDVSEDHSLDDLLYSQRVVIRNIERRLTRVIADAMASAGTWREQLDVLMLFEPVLARKDVQFSLQQPRIAVLEAVIDEVVAVEAECIAQSTAPPIFDNMPPYAGALYWSESIRQRFYEPLQRVRRILKAEIEGTDVGKMLVAVWTRILEMLENFDQALISDWEQVCVSSVVWLVRFGLLSLTVVPQELAAEAYLEHLRKPILVRSLSDAEIIVVNFDPMIEAVIREVTYMRRLGIVELPDAVIQFYSKATHLLKDKAQLRLTVELYEHTQKQLLGVERSLLETRLSAISNELDRGMDGITWRSSSIASFISLVSTQVSDLSTAVHSLHRITQMIQTLIPGWSKRMIYKDEMMRCLPSHQYLELQASHTAARYYEVQEDVNAIDKQIVACRMLLGVNNKSLAWQRHVSCARLIFLSCLLRSRMWPALRLPDT